MKFSEVLALSSLKGFRIVEVYYLRLKIKFGPEMDLPAIIIKTGKFFVCLNKETIVKALSVLSRREFEIRKIPCLVNEKKRIAFSLWCYDSAFRKEMDPFSLLTSKDLKKIKFGDLEWTHVFEESHYEMTKEEFTKALQLALSRI